MEIAREPREFFRKHPEFALPGGHISGLALTKLVLDDVFRCENNQVTVSKFDRYMSITAERDWMALDKHTLEALFQTIVSVSPAPYEEHRSEIVVASLASGFWTSGCAGVYRENFDEEDLPQGLTLLEHSFGGRQLVFFV